MRAANDRPYRRGAWRTLCAATDEDGGQIARATGAGGGPSKGRPLQGGRRAANGRPYELKLIRLVCSYFSGSSTIQRKQSFGRKSMPVRSQVSRSKAMSRGALGLDSS